MQDFAVLLVRRAGAQVTGIVVAVADDVPVWRMQPNEVERSWKRVGSQVETAAEVGSPVVDAVPARAVQSVDDVSGCSRSHHRVGDSSGSVSEDQVLEEPSVAVPAETSVSPQAAALGVRDDGSHPGFLGVIVVVGCVVLCMFECCCHCVYPRMKPAAEAAGRFTIRLRYAAAR